MAKISRSSSQLPEKSSAHSIHSHQSLAAHMESHSKAGNMHDDVATDMISSLPDEVLTIILSFLSTKEAVQTCILARRWSKVWATVPVLKFDLGEFCNPDADSDEEVKECMDNFERFVTGVLDNWGPSCLDTFEYSWDSEDSYYHDTSLELLDRVIVLMPRVIKIYICSNRQLNLSDSTFSCASLQNLILSMALETTCIYRIYRRAIIRPGFFNLPSLKILELHDVYLVDDCMRKLFMSCPALESLILDHCDLDMFDITSDVLQVLDISRCWLSQGIRICCPSLVSLSFQSSCPVESISLENMGSLANAVIKLSQSDYYDFRGYSPIMNVLRGLSKATTIMLYLVDLQFKELLAKDILNCRTFNNLKSLEIGEWDMSNVFDLVVYFLEHSPNLQRLTVYLNEKSQGNREEGPSKEVLRDTFFWREHLETVMIYCGKNVELAEKLVKLLKRHITTIGTIYLIP